MLEGTFAITKKILSAHKSNGFVGFTIVGGRGVGKTCASLKICTQVHMALGMSERDAWYKALDVLFYQKTDVIDFLRQKSLAEDTVPVIVIDDARVFCGGATYFLDMKGTHIFSSVIDTARDSTSCIIINCPSTRGLLSFLRYAEGYHVKLKKTSPNWRTAKGYEMKELPSSKIIILPQFLDRFHYKIPTPIYKEVMKRRRKYKELIIQAIEESSKKQKTKKKKEDNLNVARSIRAF